MRIVGAISEKIQIFNFLYELLFILGVGRKLKKNGSIYLQEDLDVDLELDLSIGLGASG